MATKSKTTEPLRYKRNSSTLKKVWDYMRRNRTFRFSDVMMITGVSRGYLKSILWHLSRVEYVQIVKEDKPYNSTQFTLIKYTGAKSPSIINGCVYDYNTCEALTIETTPALTKLLACMTSVKMSKHTIAENAGVSFAVAKRWFTKLSEMEIINEIYPLERVDGTKAFLIDLQKVEQLKQDIKSGAFKIKGAL